MNAYEKMKKIYDRERLDNFVMAVSYIMDQGFNNVQQITEEQIQNMKGNGFMTKEFCQDLVRLAKEITDTAENGVNIIQFCQAEDVFDTRYYAGQLRYYQVAEMLKSAIDALKDNVQRIKVETEGYKDKEAYIISLLGCTTEDYCLFMGYDEEREEELNNEEL